LLLCSVMIVLVGMHAVTDGVQCTKCTNFAVVCLGGLQLNLGGLEPLSPVAGAATERRWGRVKCRT